jgi:membrane protease subunit HflK
MSNQQWGKKGGDGPPDLDELWRRFNQRLSETFGGKGRNSSQPPAAGPGRSIGAGGLLLVIGVLLAVWLVSGFYIVKEGERGVVARFGRYNEVTLPGARWALPYPIEQVEKVSIEKIEQVEVGFRRDEKAKEPRESLMLTDDENIVDVQFTIQYRLEDPVAHLYNNATQHEDLVKQAAETAIREVVGRSKMDYVLYEGRSDISARAATVMQQLLSRYKTGILINNVTMQNAQPPEEVQAAFSDAQKAKQDQERQKSEGQAYANDVVPKARGVASRLMAEANGYQQRVVANAEGDASRFTQVLTEYDRAPAVMRQRMYLDTMQQFLANSTKVMIDQKAGGNNLLYLPIDKLMQMASDSAAAAAAEPNPMNAMEPSPSPEVLLRSPDSLRNDRGTR